LQKERIDAGMCAWQPGEGSGSDLGAGGSAREMEYDGREAGIGASAGKEGDMGRSGQIGGGGGGKRRGAVLM
jgi:hypothetical protein